MTPQDLLARHVDPAVSGDEDLDVGDPNLIVEYTHSHSRKSNAKVERVLVWMSRKEPVAIRLHPHYLASLTVVKN